MGKFKKSVKESDESVKQSIEEVEELASIISAKKRNELGHFQHWSVKICGLSSKNRNLFCQTNVKTLIKIMRPLGLTLSVSLA